MMERLAWRALIVALAVTVVGPMERHHVAAQAPPTTDIIAADAVITALLSHDSDALVAMVRYIGLGCIDAPEGIGAAPLCEVAGVPSGTIVEVLPSVHCETEYILKTIVPSVLASLAARPAEFYGVLRPARFAVALPAPADAQPTPEYAVVFRHPIAPGPIFTAVHLLDGQIVALQVIGPCGGLLPARDDPVWVVGPQS